MYLGRFTTLACALSISAGLPAIGNAQATAPILQNTFEDSTGPWTVQGGGGSVSLAHDPAVVKNGKGSLKYDYPIAKGSVSALAMPTADSMLAKMKSLHFWIHADHPSPIIIMLQQTGGVKYNYTFYAPADQWQEVNIPTSAFVMSDDANDTPGKLDLAAVENITLIDIDVMIAQSDDAKQVALLGPPIGNHSLELDDFTVSADPLPVQPAAPNVTKEKALDDLTLPQLSWLALGGQKLEKSTGKPLAGAAVKFSYHVAPGSIAGLVHSVPAGLTAGMDQLALTMASTKPAKFVVQLEQTGGGKYNTIIDVPGDSMLKEFWLPFSDLTMAQDSGDKQGHFDASKVIKVILLDGSGFLTQADQDNTIWLNRLRVGPK